MTSFPTSSGGDKAFFRQLKHLGGLQILTLFMRKLSTIKWDTDWPSWAEASDLHCAFSLFLRHSGDFISIIFQGWTAGVPRAGTGHGSYAPSTFGEPGSVSPAQVLCHSVAPTPPQFRMNSPIFETEALRGLTLSPLPRPDLDPDSQAFCLFSLPAGLAE